MRVPVEDHLEFEGQPVSLTDVRVHELLLMLQWLAEARREYQKPISSAHGPDYYEAKLQSLFRRTAN